MLRCIIIFLFFSSLLTPGWTYADQPLGNINKPNQTINTSHNPQLTQPIDNKQIIAEFVAAIEHVTASQINANQAGSMGTAEFWRSGSQDVFSYQNWGTNTFTRNPKHVLQAAGVDLSSISAPSWIKPLNQQQLTGTAISPLHIISAAHWHPALGQDIYFTDAHNQTVARQIVTEQQIIDPRGGKTDLWVALLSAPLPATIKPMQILPTNYANNLQMTNGVPVWTCQGGAITVSSLWTGTRSDDGAPYQPPSKGYDVTFTKHSGQFDGWNAVIHGGSGSPIFLVVNHEPVLLSILHYMGGVISLGGPSVADLAKQINQAMADLQAEAKPYQLTEIRLTP